MIVRWALNIQLSVVSANVIADIVLCKYIPDRQTVYIEEHGPENFTVNVRSSKYDLNHYNAVCLTSISWRHLSDFPTSGHKSLRHLPSMQHVN